MLRVTLTHAPISPEEWLQRRERFKKLMIQQIVAIIDQGLADGRFIVTNGKVCATIPEKAQTEGASVTIQL